MADFLNPLFPLISGGSSFKLQVHFAPAKPLAFFLSFFPYLSPTSKAVTGMYRVYVSVFMFEFFFEESYVLLNIFGWLYVIFQSFTWPVHVLKRM